MNVVRLLLGLLLLRALPAIAQVAPEKPRPLLPVGFSGDDPLWHCSGCQYPVYKDGGTGGMMWAISQNLRFPPGLQTDGRVFVQFTIDTTGQVRNVIVKRAFYPEADSNAVQTVRLLGRFTPALDPQGRPMAAKLIIPITFSIK
ncbi:energy transducer TonB family protein [Hymenobacter actinosclerus]|uniref:TonB protein C-terminal n=1 Tax=Hymenobacter actinosclerus TaxID=82805 RepID=A0A1I0I2F5_9BACT|nr:energy transducer TonB [Hymenobacter actinosclerus]SET90739.1 TonB protein C-terminal [Hymenobacter actinosclerus]